MGRAREVYPKEIAKCVYEELSITDKIKVVETNKLNLIDIQTADFEVREMTISQHCMSILYDEVYHIPTERYIKNIKIDISNWKDLLVKIFIYENTYSLPNEVLLEGSNIEPFDLIQEINISDNILLLKGISKKNKYWMEYKIINSKFSIKVFDNG